MKWFKHDSNASTDAKVKKLLIRYGVTGYAIYFHCLELIASDVSETNLTFQLEHDSEIIADNLKIIGDSNRSGIDVVEEVMRYIIELGLFESNSNVITCMKIAKRLDQSMTNNKRFRDMISKIKDNSKGYVYIIKSEYGYKIGKTKNYESRIKLFSVKLPFDFNLVRLYKTDDYNNDETLLHKKYSQNIINGEWYSINEKDLLNIDNYFLNNNGEIIECHDMSCKNRIEDNRIEESTKSNRNIIQHHLCRVPINETTYNKLIADYGQDVADDYIERVSDWCDTKGVKKRDYAAAARNWIKKDNVQKLTEIKSDVHIDTIKIGPVDDE